MAGYPLGGIEGTVTSITASSDLATILHPTTGAIIPHTITINESVPALDVTAQADTAAVNRAGLSSGTAQIVAHYPFVQRQIGATGLITLAGTALAMVRSWDLTVTAGVRNISSTSQADLTSEYFCPSKKVSWSANAECLVESGTIVRTLTKPGTALASYPAFIAKIIEEGTDPTLTGVCMIQQRGHSIPIGSDDNQIVNLALTGTGALTASSGTTTAAVFPAGAIDQPSWDLDGDGVADVEMVVTAATGRTYTFKTFWNRVNIRSSMAGLISVTVDLQLTGPLTVA